MFTGIVEELGEVVSVVAGSLAVRGPLVAADARPGDSIAVGGACLTVTSLDRDTFRADVMAETLDRTCLGGLGPGDPVNLERPVAVGGRLGGHLVQGHIDGTGVITERVPGDAWETVTIGLPARLSRYVAEKGSIAVDGVSLTVVGSTDEAFTVGLIPTTLERTTLGRKRVGDPVNLEVDVLAKYVERLIGAGAEASAI